MIAAARIDSLMNQSWPAAHSTELDGWVVRRNAGVKFYRLTLMIGSALVLFAIAAHWNAHRRDLVMLDASIVIVSAVVLLTLRYPKRFTSSW